MIIYGSRMYGKKNQTRSHGRCTYCGRVGLQHSYDGRKWGHLYFIPLIPVGGKVRVLRECASCSTGAHVPVEQVPAIVESVKKGLEEVTITLGAGDRHVTMDGRPVPVAAVIAANLSDLHCLCGEPEVRQFLDNLRFVQAGQELRLAEALAAELDAREREADACFDALARASDDPLILYYSAQYLSRRARAGEAAAIAERVELGMPDNLDVKQLLVESYTALGAWEKLVGVYERSFEVEPSLKTNKAIVKLYKKACKKAGKTPVV